MDQNHRSFFMNPNMYNNFQQYVPPYMQQQQAQPIQHLPSAEPRVVTYSVESAEQLSGIVPMPNTLYMGINKKDGKIYLRSMNNDGLTEVKTYSLVTEQTKKTDMQEILERLDKIEKKLNTGGVNESNDPNVAQ